MCSFNFNAQSRFGLLAVPARKFDLQYRFLGQLNIVFLETWLRSFVVVVESFVYTPYYIRQSVLVATRKSEGAMSPL